MTDEFQRGLITGLAMQPLQVTTEHATPDAPATGPSESIVTGSWLITFGAPTIIGEVLSIKLGTEGS